MKTIEDLQTLIQKYQDGTCTPREKQLLENWYNERSNNNPNVEFPQDFWQDKEARLQQILSSSRKKKKISLIMPLPLQILIIAATVAVIGSIWTVLTTGTSNMPPHYSTDINPGGNKAILTLQNGKRIQLSDTKEGVVIDASKIGYNDGTLIDDQSAQTFTVSTPRGGNYQVRLPDSSMVWLNAASSLTYSPPKNGQRNVKLVGEAYFEVHKNKHPFIVTNDKQRIEVLGTHFNVSAYNDERSIKTTLLEGSVKVTPLSSANQSETKEIILKPNQESVLNSAGIQVKNVDAVDAVAWKNGEFVFSGGENLESIMQKIARWYNVDVIYADKNIGVKVFNGTVSKFDRISKVLMLLERTKEVKFQIEGRRVTVMPP